MPALCYTVSLPLLRVSRLQARRQGRRMWRGGRNVGRCVLLVLRCVLVPCPSVAASVLWEKAPPCTGIPGHGGPEVAAAGRVGRRQSGVARARESGGRALRPRGKSSCVTTHPLAVYGWSLSPLACGTVRSLREHHAIQERSLVGVQLGPGPGQPKGSALES